tara:strand:+ start:68 stop:481 length:414 start_codon:yes stop_codon:yes gene_type:complete
MNYTYRQLLTALQELSSDELDMHVTVYDRTNEVYHPLNYTGKCEGDDVLDADHPIMIINDPEENVSESEVIREFPDVRSCEVWLEFADGSTLTTDAFLDMDKCIETQIRDTFFSPHAIKSGSVKSPGVNFKWKELGI